MGIGSYPAGIGSAGHDPPTTFDVLAVEMPLAAAFDPELRLFTMTEEGEIAGVHPVDQEVALRLGVPLGSIASATGVGLDMRRLRRASPASVAAAVSDVVQGALADLVRLGDIELIGTPLMADAFGRPFFFVDYRNLRLPGAPRALAQIGRG